MICRPEPAWSGSEIARAKHLKTPGAKILKGTPELVGVLKTIFP